MGKEFHRSVGLELAGAKSHRSSLAVLDYYPQKERLILLDVQAGMHDEAKLSDKSPDEILVAKLTELKKSAPRFAGLSVHGPISFPSFIDKALNKKVPLARQNPDPEAKWMLELWSKLRPQPRPFVPYLQRPAELWLRHCTQEQFLVTDAFGANGAPIAARLRVLLPYFPKPVHEAYPRATLNRLCTGLKMPKWIAGTFTDLEQGLKAREEFVTCLLQRLPQLFIYDPDFENIVTHLSSFNAFLSAMNQFLLSKAYCENPPRSFPKKATWIPIPRSVIPWEKLFK